MIFKQHSDLIGKHSTLSPSKYHWLNYSDERMFEYVENLQAARLGTELHELASRLIRLGVKLPDNGKTLNMYVNDAIGFRMTPELILFYSYNAFGSADALSFGNGVLRIHDLKTGQGKASETQLAVYAALFCLEYGIKRPSDIEIELRIYQNDEIFKFDTDPGDIVYIMDRIKELDALINKMNEEV